MAASVSESAGILLLYPPSGAPPFKGTGGSSARSLTGEGSRIELAPHLAIQALHIRSFLSLVGCGTFLSEQSLHTTSPQNRQ